MFGSCGIYHNNLVYGGGVATGAKRHEVSVSFMVNTTLVDGKLANSSLLTVEV